MANILRSSLISIAATGASLAAGFVSNIIASRMLGPSGAGLIAFSLWAATSASAVADLGLPQTMLRNAGAASGPGDAWKGLVHSALRTFLLSVMLVGAGMLGYAAWLGRHEDGGAWRWAVTAALFVAYALAAFSTAVARGRGRFGQTAISTAIGGALQVPLVLVGAWFWGAAGALIGHVARYLPQALRLRGYFRHPARPLTPEMRSYAGNMWLSDLVENIILSRIEFLFLGIFFASTQIGYFASGLALAGLVEQIMLQISPALIVGFADAHSRGDMKSLQTSYSRVMRMVSLIIFPVTFGGAAIIPALLPLVFGEPFTPAIPAAVILMATVGAAALAVIPWGLISAASQSQQILRIQIFSGFLTIILLLAIVPWAGLEGAACSRAGVSLLTLAILLYIAARHIGIATPWAALIRTMIAGGLCAAAAAIPVMMMPPIPAIAVGVIAGALVYIFAIRMLRLVDPDDAGLLLAAVEGKLPGPAKRIAASLSAFIAPR
ncbi:MAG: lipopolysaccharide biosynthesis protein [Sphingobium phenoxybenzoativorans]